MDRFVQRYKRGTGHQIRTAPSRSRSESEPRSEPPKKRTKLDKVKDSDSDDSALDTSSANEEDADPVPENSFIPVEDDSSDTAFSTTIETSLPAIAIDEQTIKEYEELRASQASQEPPSDVSDSGPSARLDSRRWIAGKSSIYVDAFNLALDTVLEDEAHLFNAQELAVFEHWRSLTYEAQYLYVRLFLRKTAAWHRIERLGYHSDVSDMERAVATLLESRPLPCTKSELADNDVQAGQTWSLEGSFRFADDSASCIETVDEAASLLSHDELKSLAKEVKVQGKNKAELYKSFCRGVAQQSSLLALGLRKSSANQAPNSESQPPSRTAHFLSKILAITGPLIRLSEPVFKLFERVHLVFYRSTEWTEKSLTTIILAKMARRNYASYIVCRSANIFPSRAHLLEFELSMRKEYEVDKALELNEGDERFLKVLEVFESIAPRWRELLKEEKQREETVYEFGEGGYLRRFNAAHSFTRIAHKAAHALGRLHRYKEEHSLLCELLEQRLFHPARRGSWYQRKALLEERYMWEADPDPVSMDPEVQKRHWQRIALLTCETALEDRDCHLIYHYDLQKRLVKLERRLRVPRRLQHDFGHVKLREPEEHTVHGIQLVRDEPDPKGKTGRAVSTKTWWLDELGDPGEDGQPLHVSVEEMCLSHYRSQGWKGYHSEGGILRTLFAYLFFDILFTYVPNVFQTAYQTCPLDLHTDAFYPTRASQINHRLVEIANGEAERILREVHEREHERRTCVVGLNWDFDIEDLAELVSCFDGSALAAMCKVMAQDYKTRGSGVPDLILWRTSRTPGAPSTVGCRDGGSNNVGEVMFAEVKSTNDRLSDTQRLWINVLSGAGIRVALCNAVAREVRQMS